MIHPSIKKITLLKMRTFQALDDSPIMRSPLVQIKNLSIHYTIGKRKFQALSDISLEIGQNEIVVLAGETGSGKSTVGKALLGLLPNNAIQADRAIIHYQDHPLHHEDFRKLRGKEFSLIAQNPLMALNPTRRCGSQIKEVIAKFRPEIKPKNRTAQILELLQQCDLRDAKRVYNSYPHQLSLGQLQRVNIAMALAPDPKLIIADEPFSSLDLVTKNRLVHLIRKLRDRQVFAMLLITHDLGLIDLMGDRWYVLKGGYVQGSGTGEFLRGAHDNPFISQLCDNYRSLDKPKTDLSDRTVPLMEAVSLSFAYPTARWWFRAGAKPVLFEIDLQIRKGEIFGIVGRSGSGKSTLAKLLGGLLTPSEGALYLQSQPVNFRVGQNRRSYFQEVQYILQDSASSLPPAMPMGEILQLSLQAFFPERKKADIEARCRELFQSVSLDPILMERSRSQLSGGEMQRMCIARALCAEPQLLILDESLTDLDQNVQAEILDLLQYLNATEFLTIVLVAHDLRLIRHICDHILVLRSGRVDTFGAWQEINTSSQSPYLRELIDAI